MSVRCEAMSLKGKLNLHRGYTLAVKERVVIIKAEKAMIKAITAGFGCAEEDGGDMLAARNRGDGAGRD
ncbi:hypothetical protein M2323_003569 [Rhodoblastus acidophilus]|uniref:hypothetical protein n=1 Tax=Rhodoblastus acidophilus TaxID=1074 RepID=UPI00222434CC|nr:hypothetical protein [Rhodoblastus acidophilus]MCW2285614.1 hypothetical protein [Rhodoblastus acidophilus]MCW2334628.1 hypothetical protein [Rhodoblastus acidophilus]